MAHQSTRSPGDICLGDGSIDLAGFSSVCHKRERLYKIESINRVMNMANLAVLEQTVASMFNPQVVAPPAGEVVEELLAWEKLAKREKMPYGFEQLSGAWRLCWITGEKQGRSLNLTQMRLAQTLLRLIPIQLVYHPLADLEGIDREKFEAGEVENRIQIGLFTLVVFGPAKRLKSNSLLAFDFTTMQIKFFDKVLFSTLIRNGENRNARFYGAPIRELAFFNYFLVQDKLIAARGRGGGLALWGRSAG
ncbi:hypothetical protein [Roseofilum sp. Guam]|uniref:hypothetical protein n=1 Tax=Roseofilum sp. Guam TaxID=2821502 RepID=UPI001B150C24|nr:hypothetical protein [Roseofilum sp. Guam]MBP0030192.1 hypothetical protein [Roseofilum sp. Guam]